jgi:squalene synthase HpnC
MTSHPVAVMPAPASHGSTAAAIDASQAAFAPAASLADAEDFTRRLAHGHYENFSVISLLLPKRLRQDFCNLYAFCRIADDLGDELGDAGQALRLLDRFRDDLHRCYAAGPATAVYVALANTIQKHAIPIQPFLDLIDAFQQDQRITRYQTFDDVVDYCRRSANPVGRLVLFVCGYRDETRQRLSDDTCTALQLANFWQDVRRDLLDLDRIYLPADSMARFGVSESQLRAQRVDDNYRNLIRFEVDRAEALFARGAALLPTLHPSVRPHISLFGRGGRAILQAIRNQRYDTLTSRPRLSALQKGRLMLPALAAHLAGCLRPAAQLPPAQLPPAQLPPAQLPAAQLPAAHLIAADGTPRSSAPTTGTDA